MRRPDFLEALPEKRYHDAFEYLMNNREFPLPTAALLNKEVDHVSAIMPKILEHVVFMADHTFKHPNQSSDLYHGFSYFNTLLDTYLPSDPYPLRDQFSSARLHKNAEKAWEEKLRDNKKKIYTFLLKLRKIVIQFNPQWRALRDVCSLLTQYPTIVGCSRANRCSHYSPKESTSTLQHSPTRP